MKNVVFSKLTEFPSVVDEPAYNRPGKTCGLDLNAVPGFWWSRMRDMWQVQCSDRLKVVNLCQ